MSQQPELCPPSSTPEEHNRSRMDCFFDVAERLGMQPGALEGWRNIHEAPHVAASCCTVANLTALVMNTCVLSIGSRPIRWDLHAPTAGYTLCHVASAVMLWQRGPEITRAMPYYALVVPAILTQVALSTLLMLSPIEYVPFGGRLTFALTSAVRMWFWAFAATTGAWYPDSPAHPHKCDATHFVNCQNRFTVRTTHIGTHPGIRYSLRHFTGHCSRQCWVVIWNYWWTTCKI